MSLRGTTKGLGYVEMMQAAIAYRESFRLLYTNISLLGSKQMPIRSLVVGSAARDDGKSTIAQHLAETAAALGQRVLLVDADLRHPQLHQRLGLKNNYGLSDLVQRGLNLNEVIQQYPNQADLFLLSGGSGVDDPVKLFSSPQLEHLMEQFRSFFDLVIYNTPPLVGLSDAQLVAKHADGILLVVRLEQTDRIMVDKALESLKIAGTIVLGCVANDVKNYVPFSYHPPTNLASSPSPSLSGFPPFSSLN
jgi:capsular exopolysaccharide synthesis family protein